jgi:Trk-type K+ transport system membrane component
MPIVILFGITFPCFVLMFYLVYRSFKLRRYTFLPLSISWIIALNLTALTRIFRDYPILSESTYSMLSALQIIFGIVALLIFFLTVLYIAKKHDSKKF